MSNQRTARNLLQHMSIANASRYLILVLLFMMAAALAPGFLTIQNVLNLLRSFSFLGFISIGMTFVILNGGLDLSVASVLAFSTVVTGLMQHWGIYLGHVDELSLIYPTPFIILTVLLMGSLIGLINGIVITRLRIADFVATLGMMVFVRGMAFAISGGRTVFGLDSMVKFIGRGLVAGIPFVAVLWIGSIIICAVVLRYTIFGINLYATGENPEAARLSGASPIFYKIAVYTISGFFAALAGICMAGRLDVGEPRVAQGWELDAIAAVVIGGTLFAGGYGGVVRTIIGVVIIGLIRNILGLLGILPDPQQLIMGLVLLFAVILQSFISRREL
jgi:ribose transport system permease protein